MSGVRGSDGLNGWNTCSLPVSALLMASQCTGLSTNLKPSPWVFFPSVLFQDCCLCELWYDAHPPPVHCSGRERAQPSPLSIVIQKLSFHLVLGQLYQEISDGTHARDAHLAWRLNLSVGHATVCLHLLPFLLLCLSDRERKKMKKRERMKETEKERKTQRERNTANDMRDREREMSNWARKWDWVCVVCGEHVKFWKCIILSPKAETPLSRGTHCSV